MKLFFNYRREDTEDLAGRLYDHLITEFGTEHIFKDVDSIRPGANWKLALEESVASCDVMLSLIGHRWLDCEDAEGNRRLDNENDFVRIEIETARQQNKIIVPVLVKGMEVPRLDLLSEEIRWLAEIHFTEVRSDPFFKDDVVRLINELKRTSERLKTERLLEQAQQSISTASGSSGSTSDVIACPQCQKSCSGTDQFCDACGAKLCEQCPACDETVGISQRFCKSCGADIPQVRQTRAIIGGIQDRLGEAAAQTVPEERVQQLRTLVREIAHALTIVPEHSELVSLKQKVEELSLQSAGEAADRAFESKNYNRALVNYRLIEQWRPDSSLLPQTQDRVQFIERYRAEELKDVSQCRDRGDYKKACRILTRLREEFPGDGEIEEELEECQGILNRADQLMKSGLRKLLNAHKLFAAEAELEWLKSQHIQSGKIPELTKTVRNRIQKADEWIRKANTFSHEGQLQKAQKIAQQVKQSVVDHPGVDLILNSSGGVIQQLDELKELVRIKHWTAANAVLLSLPESLKSEKRISALSARISEV